MVEWRETVRAGFAKLWPVTKEKARKNRREGVFKRSKEERREVGMLTGGKRSACSYT